MPLYQINENQVVQLKPSSFISEKELQRLFEANLETLLGVRFISSEFTTGDRQRGRIDTLGIDQNGTPTIIEYKKVSRENVINQGLYYLDWLVDHKGDFTVAAQQKIGSNIAIDWSNPRLVLITEEFTEYDKYAVNRMGANIELWVYRLYAESMLYLEPIFIPAATRARTTKTLVPRPVEEPQEVEIPAEERQYDLEWHLARKPSQIRELMSTLREHILGLAEEGEITEKPTQVYIGYRHGKNFCEVIPHQSFIKLWLDIRPDELDDPKNITRDVSRIGHHGTGQVEVRLTEMGDVGYVMSLVEQAYHLTL